MMKKPVTETPDNDKPLIDDDRSETDCELRYGLLGNVMRGRVTAIASSAVRAAGYAGVMLPLDYWPGVFDNVQLTTSPPFSPHRSS